LHGFADPRHAHSALAPGQAPRQCTLDQVKQKKTNLMALLG
jgi:hypothetical protein